MSGRRLPTFLVFSAVLAACTLPGVSNNTYNVGDTGPGGGIVFYVHRNGTFASIGSDCGASCKYLEAAPADLKGGVEDGFEFEWCSGTESELGVSATEIGTGMANTTTAAATCTSGAIQVAADYVNNGKTDWHLPSMVELYKLCKYAFQQSTGDKSEFCLGEDSGPLRTGSLRTGFSADYYWSSSEFSAGTAWYHNFLSGSPSDHLKSATLRVRPVRAF
jgi:hypothetical protein